MSTLEAPDVDDTWQTTIMTLVGAAVGSAVGPFVGISVGDDPPLINPLTAESGVGS